MNKIEISFNPDNQINFTSKDEAVYFFSNVGKFEKWRQFAIGDAIINCSQSQVLKEDNESDTDYIKRGLYAKVSELTGIEVKTLQKYVTVAKSTNSSLRREELTFSHYELVSKYNSEDQTYWLDKSIENSYSVNQLRTAIKQSEIADTEAEREDVKTARPIVYYTDAVSFIDTFEDKSVDLLFTDPPYSTDIEDLDEFIDSWLSPALSKVKDTGRAFICIGAYPIEQYLYLERLLATDWILDNPLIWTYRNTLGQTPKMKYNLNYQIVMHLYKNTSNPLDNRITKEMFSVQDINAPDGRIGDRYHTWQKPDELAMIDQEIADMNFATQQAQERGLTLGDFDLQAATQARSRDRVREQAAMEAKLREDLQRTAHVIGPETAAMGGSGGTTSTTATTPATPVASRSAIGVPGAALASVGAPNSVPVAPATGVPAQGTPYGKTYNTFIVDGDEYAVVKDTKENRAMVQYDNDGNVLPTSPVIVLGQKAGKGGTQGFFLARPTKDLPKTEMEKYDISYTGKRSGGKNLTQIHWDAAAKDNAATGRQLLQGLNQQKYKTTQELQDPDAAKAMRQIYQRTEDY